MILATVYTYFMLWPQSIRKIYGSGRSLYRNNTYTSELAQDIVQAWYVAPAAVNKCYNWLYL